MLDFEWFTRYWMGSAPQPALSHLFVRFRVTAGGVSEQVTASNDFQAAVTLSLESIEIAER